MLSNMHAPDVCRFLDDVRRDGEAQFSSFDWGQASTLPVLPRVQAGRVVLSPTQWRIDNRVRNELAPETAGAFNAALRTWRARWQVPRHVYLSYGDNRLLLDLESEPQAEERSVRSPRAPSCGSRRRCLRLSTRGSPDRAAASSQS